MDIPVSEFVIYGFYFGGGLICKVTEHDEVVLG